MQFIIILPLEIAVVLLLFCIAAPFAVVLNLPHFIAATLPALSYIGFTAMCLLTLQIYIWAFTKQA